MGTRNEFDKEFHGADLGDERLNRRLSKLATALAEDPAESLPRRLDGAALEAAYRFVNNEDVSPEKVLAPHIRETKLRIGEGLVLAVHDTTQFGFRADGARKGLGKLRSTQQFFSHVTLAVRPGEAREPLGVLNVYNFIRKENENGRWLEQARKTAQIFEKKNVVHVMDREGDDFLILAGLLEEGARFVIRACQDRKISGPTEKPTRINEAAPTFMTKAVREVPIAARTNTGRNPAQRKRYPARNMRMAALQISAAPVVLERPQMRSPERQTTTTANDCALNMVRVWEPSPPNDEAPVEWFLFTTEPIDSAEDVLRVVDIYRARWRIEELFKALKTGCAFEKRQLESYEALVNALSIFLPIAWRLLHLRAQTSETPDAPATTLLDADELEVLRRKARRPLPTQPTRRDALLAIAGLGGHLKHNGEPGWQTIGKGLEHLLTMVEGFRLVCPRSDQS